VLFAWPFLPKLARAEGRDPRMLTIVLRGALDGLAAVAPVGDPDWVKLRGDKALVLDGKTPALPLDSFFALNPAMPNLHRLYKAGQATIVHAAAIAFSLWIIAGSRPVFLVAAVDRIVAVSANAIADTDLQQGRSEEFRTRSWTGPRLAAIELPTEPAERNHLVFLVGDRNVEDLPRYYVAYGEGSKTLLPAAKALDALRGKNAEAAALVDGWLRRSGRNADDIRWVPLQARKDDLVMLLDRRSAQPLQALAINPW